MLWYMIAWDAKGPFSTRGLLSGGYAFYFNRRGQMDAAVGIIAGDPWTKPGPGYRTVAIYRCRADRSQAFAALRDLVKEDGGE